MLLLMMFITELTKGLHWKVRVPIPANEREAEKLEQKVAKTKVRTSGLLKLGICVVIALKLQDIRDSTAADVRGAKT